MNQERLVHELELVAARYRHLRLWQALAAAWLLAAACGGLLLWLRWSTGAAVPLALPLLATAALILAGGSAAIALASARRLEWVAQRIELAYPELGTCLLAAIEQRPDLPDGRFGYLQSSVIREALTHADRHEWRQRVVPSSRLWLAALTNAASLVVLLLVLAGLASQVAGPAAASASSGAPVGPGGGLSVAIEPGDAEVERGTSLLVLARFKGDPPAEATLIYKTSAGDESRLAMSRSLDDPVFGGRIPSVDAPLEYRVELSNTLASHSAVGSDANAPSGAPAYASDTFHVEVFDYPELRRADARLAYPRYTNLDERLVQDVRTVSVVEGTELTLLCYLNKPVVSARFVDRDGAPLALAAHSGEQACYEATFKAEKSRRLKLELVDDRGRKNVKQAEIAINVHPNRPPTLKPTFPARDLEVSPLEEMDVKATIWDDYGVARYGLTYSMAGGEPVDVVLGERSAAKERHELAHTIRFEDLAAEPDQLLSYHFWAEDHAADGSIRRTQSDMYFSEVRPFEEIYRQGQQPPGGQQQQQQQGQGQNAQQAAQLAELQKEIINATWKIIRRESGAKLTDTFGADVESVHLSQASAIEQATTLAGRLQDPQSQEHLEDVLQAMQQALSHLKSAHGDGKRDPLTPALAAEQAAYQALLKLRAREHSVIRAQQQQQQQSSSSRNSSSRAQQQLEQLELSNEQNRYETQRTAQSLQEEDQAQREERQVLNRLKELARRQHDLNERLKELQTALEEAKTEEEKEEIRRQLARLQEEQRRILEDTDELQSRMDQPENQERMADERQQLEQTRDDVRRASEALEQQQVTRAAAAGTRAETQFEELKNEFRRRASSRFRDDARELRDNARELDEREQELAQRMAEATGQESGDREQESGVRSQESGDRKAKSLSEGVDRQQLATELGEQRQRLAELERRMRQTIDEAEPTEPLLAEKLYDAARGIQDRGIDRALDTTQRSLRQGLLSDAQRLEEQARRGIAELRKGIEQAAESVLGDDTEALRRARQQLENLANELNDEIARNTQETGDRRQEADDGRQPGERQERQGQENGAGRRPSGQQQEGQQQDGQQQDGQQQDGQGRPGQRQPGERQEGQNQQGQGQPGERQAGENQQGQDQPGQAQQPGQQQPGEQQGQGSPQGGRPGEPRDEEGQRNRPGQQGRPGEPNQEDGERQPGDRNQPGQSGQRRGPRDGRSLSDWNQRGSAGPFTDSSEGFMNPLTGEDFLNWSDRLRDVEEMVDDPELRAEAARIRERARAARAEFRRHSAEPQWDLVRAQVAEPLGELRDRVVEELLRRASRQALVPLDRDPVPPKYSERTRRYYERLGAGALGSDGNAGSAP